MNAGGQHCASLMRPAQTLFIHYLPTICPKTRHVQTLSITGIARAFYTELTRSTEHVVLNTLHRTNTATGCVALQLSTPATLPPLLRSLQGGVMAK